jgi:hypothetical protein
MYKLPYQCQFWRVQVMNGWQLGFLVSSGTVNNLFPVRSLAFYPHRFCCCQNGWHPYCQVFMITATELTGFLQGTPAISRLNFAITMPSGRTFLVYPQGFATIAQQFANGSIGVVQASLPAGLCATFATSVGGLFRPELRLSASSSLGSIVDQMTIVHECTHALFNYQGIAGAIVNSEDEKICHFIEVVYLAALRVPCPTSGLSPAYAGAQTRALAERIAWGGLYRFNFSDYPVLARFARSFGYN